MTEFEKKALLSKEEYELLAKRFCRSPGASCALPSVEQTNYYFDTDDYAMNRRNITCRIRRKNGSYQGTMKLHEASGERSTELEVTVRSGISDNAFIDLGLKLQGTLTTHRCVLQKEPYCEVILDRNTYLGTSDYELEIEYQPAAEKEAQTIYRELLDLLPRRRSHAAYAESEKEEPHTPSKSNRFFTRKAADSANRRQSGDRSSAPQLPEISNS